MTVQDAVHHFSVAVGGLLDRGLISSSSSLFHVCLSSVHPKVCWRRKTFRTTRSPAAPPTLRLLTSNTWRAPVQESYPSGTEEKCRVRCSVRSVLGKCELQQESVVLVESTTDQSGGRRLKVSVCSGNTDSPELLTAIETVNAANFKFYFFYCFKFTTYHF